MSKPVLEELRQLTAAQAPEHARQSVLRWRDELGQDEAVAVLERDHEIVRLAYRWRTGGEWRAKRQDLTLSVARTATGGVYRMWQCPPQKRCGKAARRVYEAPGGSSTLSFLACRVR
jgi:hypothetical protein